MAADDFIANDRYVARYVPVTSRTEVQYFERPENADADKEEKQSWAFFSRRVDHPDFLASFRGQPRRTDAGQE